MQRKKQFSSLTISPHCPELEDDGLSPVHILRRDPEPKDQDLEPQMEEKVTKRKRESRAKKVVD